MEKYYEDSVDAYHAFMGTYTDAVADEEAPDRVIDEAVHKLVTLVQEARQVVINEVLSGLPKRKSIDNYPKTMTLDQIITADGIDLAFRNGFNFALTTFKQQLEGLLGKENQ